MCRGSIYFIRDVDADHARKHRYFEVANTVPIELMFDQLRLDKLEVLPFGAGNFNIISTSFAISAYYIDHRRCSKRERGMLGRHNLFTVYPQQNIPRLDPRTSCSAAFVYVLKDPTSSFIRLIFEVGSTQRSTA